MKKIKSISNFNSFRTEAIWEKISKKVTNKYSEFEIKIALNSLNDKIILYEISSSKTIKSSERKKLLIFEISIKSNKKNNLELISGIISKSFESIQPLIIIFNHLNTFSVFLKINCLNNEFFKNNLKKQSFITNFYSSDEKERFLNFENINLNSIFEMFDEMCRQIVYQEFYKKYDFNTNITWEIIDSMYELQKIDKKCNIIAKKMNKSYDEQEKILFLRETKKLKERKREILKNIENKIY